MPAVAARWRRRPADDGGAASQGSAASRCLQLGPGPDAAPASCSKPYPRHNNPHTNKKANKQEQGKEKSSPKIPCHPQPNSYMSFHLCVWGHKSFGDQGQGSCQSCRAKRSSIKRQTLPAGLRCAGDTQLTLGQSVCHHQENIALLSPVTWGVITERPRVFYIMNCII